MDVENLIKIGFCQPKFYKRSVWLKAKNLMDNVVVPAGLAKPFDYGRGKGKYTTNLSIEEVIQKTIDILELIAKDNK
jgi:hypothetical protein